MERNSYITDTSCITPLGFDVASNWKALIDGYSGIKLHSRTETQQAFLAAVVDEVMVDAAFASITTAKHFTKLEKMLILALNPLIGRHTITNRTLFVLSTTKGNIRLLEDKNNTVEAAHLSVLAKKVSAFFGIVTEPVVVSNACVSGLLAIAVAKRMIQSGAYDHAFVVAGDAVSEFVLSGFNSFQAMSEKPCKPYDKNRNGVTLGEATAAVYITSDENEVRKGDVKIIGDGAINDANHISGPSRTGEGLFRSIESAFNESGLPHEKLHYISAHGTATLYNDEMEAVAFNRLGFQQVPVNSLKGYFGHTLGTSGLLETVIAIESMRKNQVIGTHGFAEMGVSHPINVSGAHVATDINYFLKTASGFGGCNTAVLFEKVC